LTIAIVIIIITKAYCSMICHFIMMMSSPMDN
jgi:hypothetical protein